MPDDTYGPGPQMNTLSSKILKNVKRIKLSGPYEMLGTDMIGSLQKKRLKKNVIKCGEKLEVPCYHPLFQMWKQQVEKS